MLWLTPWTQLPRKRCITRGRAKRSEKPTLPSDRVPVRMVHSVIVARGRSQAAAEEAKRVLRERGYKLTPYSTGICLGWYAPSYDEIFETVEMVKPFVEEVAVANIVWVAKVADSVNLIRLAAAKGFIPVEKVSAVFGVVHGVGVYIFHTGTARFSLAAPIDIAERFAALIKRIVTEAGSPPSTQRCKHRVARA